MCLDEGGWVDGCVSGWVDGWVVVCLDVCVTLCMCVCVCVCVCVCAGTCLFEMDVCFDLCAHECMCVSQCVFGSVGGDVMEEMEGGKRSKRAHMKEGHLSNCQELGQTYTAQLSIVISVQFMMVSKH